MASIFLEYLIIWEIIRDSKNNLFDRLQSRNLRYVTNKGVELRWKTEVFVCGVLGKILFTSHLQREIPGIEC